MATTPPVRLEVPGFGATVTLIVAGTLPDAPAVTVTQLLPAVDAV